MARRKRTSPVLEAAHERLAGLRSITKTIEFGPELTIPAYEARINAFGAKLDAYNQTLSSLDEQQNALDDEEKELRLLNNRYLAAAGAQFGKESSEYEQAGGTRTQDRKKRKAKGAGGGGKPTT